jgi:transcriptional regulator with XRE-family HTH domain
MSDLPAIVRTLRDRRRVLGWSQDTVSGALDISERRFRSLEHGERNPTVDHLLTWASFLGLEVSLQENEGADPLGPSATSTESL